MSNYHSFDSNEINLFRSVNNTAPFRDKNTWDLHAALIGVLIAMSAGPEPQSNPPFMIVFSSRDSSFVGQKNNKLFFFFSSEYGSLNAEYDYQLNCGGYSYITSTYLATNCYNEFKNKVDRYAPINPDNFTMGINTFKSMI